MGVVAVVGEAQLTVVERNVLDVVEVAAGEADELTFKIGVPAPSISSHQARPRGRGAR